MAPNKLIHLSIIQDVVDISPNILDRRQLPIWRAIDVNASTVETIRILDLDNQQFFQAAAHGDRDKYVQPG
ncbi:hypothetical protein BOH72_17400 [Mycobacterium sp. WY10]|nr:hypothetical protein BOH72_17400 [Mycobacterium sp. WY10]